MVDEIVSNTSTTSYGVPVRRPHIAHHISARRRWPASPVRCPRRRPRGRLSKSIKQSRSRDSRFRVHRTRTELSHDHVLDHRIKRHNESGRSSAVPRSAHGRSRRRRPCRRASRGPRGSPQRSRAFRRRASPDAEAHVPGHARRRSFRPLRVVSSSVEVTPTPSTMAANGAARASGAVAGLGHVQPPRSPGSTRCLQGSCVDAGAPLPSPRSLAAPSQPQLARRLARQL